MKKSQFEKATLCMILITCHCGKDKTMKTIKRSEGKGKEEG